jgi:hypothetical protein
MDHTYLDRVVFVGLANRASTRLKQFLVEQIDVNPDELAVALRQSVPDRCEQGKAPKWKVCNKVCGRLARQAVQLELRSTAYMLRAMADSVVPTPGILIEVVVDERQLTGEWEHDRSYLTLLPLDLADKPSRLIMGFGPSASGKTYWSSSLIKLFSSADPRFPRRFISIDGGIYRESSVVYRTIRDVAEALCYLGFKNLMTAGLRWFKAPSLFDSSKTKKRITEFLSRMVQEYDVPVSLYVPDTLSKCGRGLPKRCRNLFSPYVRITRDTQYIGLCIYQHKTGADCTFTGNHKCVGSKESGKAREQKDGKKYSSTAWQRSMDNGLNQARKSPYAYVIHNSGSATNRSTLTDLKPDRTFSPYLRMYQNEYHYTYVTGQLELPLTKHRVQ